MPKIAKIYRFPGNFDYNSYFASENEEEMEEEKKKEVIKDLLKQTKKDLED